MAVKLSVLARNALLDGIEAAVGASAVLKLRTGAPPADCAAADTGTVVATLNLPVDWWAAASGGTKAKSGTWQDLLADAQGTVGHYRIYDTPATTAHIQGTVTITGGGGDMTLDNPVVEANQVVTVTGYTFTAPNA